MDKIINNNRINQKETFINYIMQHPYYPWLVWGLAAGFFFFEYFARVAPGVMVDNLMRDLHTTAFQLGATSAFFYYAYIMMQIPVGMLADRFSPRWLLTWMILVSALSCIIFSNAHTIGTAAFARLLLGFGAAFAFITALKLASIWFPATRFGLLAGMTQALGMLGAAVGQAPMAYSVAVFGWRTTMVIIACLFIMLAFLVGTLVRERTNVDETIQDRLTSGREVFLGLVQVLRNPQTWWNALFVGLLYAPTEALAELWGVKFLGQAHHLTNEIAAAAVGLIFIGWAVGGPLVGWFSDHIQRRKPILLASAALSLLFISLALYLPHLSRWPLFIMLFLYGVSNTGVATSYAVSSEINPRAIAGTSMAFANMASVLIGAAFQPLIGWILDKHWNGLVVNGIPVYTNADFRMALITLPLCLILAIVVACKVRETYCMTFEAKKST